MNHKTIIKEIKIGNNAPISVNSENRNITFILRAEDGYENYFKISFGTGVNEGCLVINKQSDNDSTINITPSVSNEIRVW